MPRSGSSEPLRCTDRIGQVMGAVYENTDGMQGFVYANGHLVDTLNWDDLKDIQWFFEQRRDRHP